MSIRPILACSSLILTLYVVACVPPEYNKEKYDGIAVNFADKQVQDIYNLLERQAADSLKVYLNHQNPTFRYLAAMAFGSLKEKTALDSLNKRLKDDYVDVRTAAAFALGQIGDERADTFLLQSYERRDTLGRYTKFNAAVLEAVGKCGKAARLQDLCRISTFRHTDTALLEGQVYGIYRFGLRNIQDPISIKKMVSIVEDNAMPKSVRLVAASYLGRIKWVYDTSVTNILHRIAPIERDAEIRMALAKALGKSNTPLSTLPVLERLFRQETDYRVKINILNAVSEYAYPQIQPMLFMALAERNPHVANTAAEILNKNGSERDAQAYKIAGNNATYATSTRQIMQGAALRYLRFYPRQRDSLNQAMKTAYAQTQNPYEKALILRGLSQFGWNFSFIRDEAINTANAPVLRTTATACLAKITTSPDFYRTFQANSMWAKNQLKAALFGIIRTGDAGSAPVAIEAVLDPAAEYNRLKLRDSIPVLYQVMSNFKMPEQLEAYDVFYKAILSIQDSTDIKKKKLSAPRAVDWSALTNLNDFSNAIVKTSKGEIRLRLLRQNAPISVANFVLLAKSGFFNGKVFHRVVPNFVVQAGCPRGDGYGSLDYTISSELTQNHYNTEGYVGMASAGNHTECSQWFITHSPSLHLDPNYTIFARVIDGMDIVHKLEVGDVIQTVLIN